MIIVSDSSVIMNLAVIKQLELLPDLFGEIIIPYAVFLEVVVEGADLPGAKELQAAQWASVKKCANNTLVATLLDEIDQGEAEAIVLALELGAELLLLDEKKGRSVANRFDLEHIGVLGILLRAKEKGLISEVRVHMDQLLSQARFFIHPDLYLQVLTLAGESITKE